MAPPHRPVCRALNISDPPPFPAPHRRDEGITEWSRSPSTRPCTTPTCPSPTRSARPPTWATSTSNSPRAPDFFFWHRYPKADDAAIADVKKACKETGVQVADAGPGVQLVVAGRAGTAGAGAQLAAPAADRRRTGMPGGQLGAVRRPERCAALGARLLQVDGGAESGLREVRHRAESRGASVRLLRDQRRRRADHPGAEQALGQLRLLRAARLPPVRRRGRPATG